MIRKSRMTMCDFRRRLALHVLLWTLWLIACGVEFGLPTAVTAALVGSVSVLGLCFWGLVALVGLKGDGHD